MKELCGQLFVEAAEKSSDDLRLNWLEKISFKLTPDIIDGCVKSLSKESVYCYKKPDKEFTIYRHQDSAVLSLADKSKAITIELNLDEALGLQNLLIRAKERIYGW